jgi:hypothetical protein
LNEKLPLVLPPPPPLRYWLRLSKAARSECLPRINVPSSFIVIWRVRVQVA